MATLAKLQPPPETEEYMFSGWKITSTKSHIMPSDCTCSQAGTCNFCKYTRELQLPSWPEMIFADNLFCLFHEATGFSLSLNALDALRLVDAKNDLMKVSASEEWLNARQGSEHIKKTLNPFDWTYTTEYSGTLNGQFSASNTDEKIDVEKLKVREPILFYSELPLFEDELADNGCSLLSFKFRCMPSGFFLLLRFYLRVDHVMVRVIDTRIHWLTENNYLLRETSWKQRELKDLDKSLNLMDANAISPFLLVHKETSDKIQF